MNNPEQIYENIFNSIIDGVLLVSPSMTVQKSNLTVEDMFHRSSDSFINQGLDELFPHQTHVLDITRKILENGACYHDVEAEGKRNSPSSQFPVNLTLSPFLGSDDSIQGVVILIKNMSLIRELKEQQRPTDHLKNLEAVTMGMAHEIRNPLGGIRGSAQLLRQEIKNKSHQEYLDVVVSEVDRIDRMVKRMMDLTRPLDLKMNKTNIHKVLEDILMLEKDTLTRKKGQFEQIYDPSLPLIDADEDRLKQAFLNLIKNAIEASRKAGKIQIITRVGSGYSVKGTSSLSPQQSIVVEIIDSGDGMDENAQKMLFTPFHTTKIKGTGLGLPISLKIIKDHDGKIKITSEKGLGTTVQVFLPTRQK